MRPPRHGTVISGTLRTEDLLEELANEAARIGLSQHLIERALAGCERIAAGGEAIDEDDILDELFDALNAVAPPGHYFGANPGDGSDFGFWPEEEE